MPLASGLLSAALVVAVVAVAFASAAPQLGIAEFSPSARSNLDAPPTTGGPDADALGRGRSGRSTTTTAPTTSTDPAGGPGSGTTPTTVVGRGRPCYGSPGRQRQSADPQSPPCIATVFQGDNGGRTWAGVTATEVRIGVPMPGSDPDAQATMNALFDHFNLHYEFYGRRLKPVFVTVSTGSDPVSNRAAATDLADADVFAVAPSMLEWYDASQPAFYKELARRGVVSSMRGLGQLVPDRTVFDEHHPYIWSAYQSAEDIWRNQADFACASLAGRVASHAGPAYTQTTRKFGVLVADYNGMLGGARTLVEGLRSCDQPPVVVQWDGARDPYTGLRDAVQKLEDAGVTTVVCACVRRSFFSAVDLGAPSAVDYQPEWMVSTSSGADDESNIQYLHASQRGHIFGLTERTKMQPVQSRAWFGAMVEIAPHLVSDYTAGSFWTVRALSQRAYEVLLVLAAGIQGAGPALTPDNFGSGLMSMQFPNEGAGQPPFWQPAVGLGPGDHSYYDDFVLEWWNSSASPLDPISSGAGSWCYVNGGTRYQVGSYPADADAKFFDANQACR